MNLELNSQEAQVGMGATLLTDTDRIACTIIEATENNFTVQADAVHYTNGTALWNGKLYRYEPDATGFLIAFRRTTRGTHAGQWRDVELSNCNVLIGHRDHYCLS